MALLPATTQAGKPERVADMTDKTLPAPATGRGVATRFKKGVCPNPDGRPKGAMNKRNQQYLEEAERRGVVPVMVMFEAISHFRQRAAEAKDPAEQDQYIRDTVAVAQVAAPFCHAKLKQIEYSGEVQRNDMLLLGRLTEDELLTRMSVKRVIEHRPLKLVKG